MSQIIWLASYPKSGNTWLRAFLTNYRSDTGQPADINALNIGRNSSARSFFDEALGIESSDLTEGEIGRYRLQVFRNMVANSSEALFLKIHDAYTLNDGEPIIPSDVTRNAIYIMRNPLDVAVSMAHHLNKSLDKTIELMSQPTAAIAKNDGRLQNQLRQQLLSWSQHVLSWVDRAPFPILVMRYEDMHRQSLETFSAALRFAGLSDDRERTLRALGYSSFDILQSQEQAHGFKEKPTAAETFFRKGQAGGWREVLTDDQIQRIISDHSAVMQRFGYLSETGQVLG